MIVLCASWDTLNLAQSDLVSFVDSMSGIQRSIRIDLNISALKTH